MAQVGVDVESQAILSLSRPMVLALLLRIPGLLRIFADAVRVHTEQRVLFNDGKTVVFA